MHVITLSADMVREDGQTVKAGRYLVDDLNAAEMLVIAERGTAEVFHFGEDDLWKLLAPDPEGDERGTILIVHPGGYGDQMMLGPAMRKHHQVYPKSDIHLCCREKQRTVFDRLDYPDTYVDYPLNIDAIAGRYQEIILTENMNELGRSGREIHAIDLKAEKLGVHLEGPEHLVEFFLSPEDIRCAWMRYPSMFYQGNIEKVRRPRVGVQLAASAYNRTPSPQLMSVVLQSLYQEEWEVIIFGSPGSTEGLFDALNEELKKKVLERVHDAADARLTFRESAAVVATCDVVLAPDSAIMHVAGALGVPCVALFGPIDYKVRTTYYPSVHALQGKEGCTIAPCFFHQRGGLFFPKDGPCHTSRRCNALDSIKPSEIGRRLNQMRQDPATRH